MIIGKIKKYLIWTLVSIILGSGLATLIPTPSKVKADIKTADRPSECRTWDKYDRCATLSADGYTLNLWYGDEDGAGGFQEFELIAMSDYGWMGSGDIGPYLYRSKSSPDFYITVRMNRFGGDIDQTHHYRSGQETQWNAYKTSNKNFRVPSESKGQRLPDYTNAFKNGKRFFWRIVANGTITFNGKPVESDEAYIKLKPVKSIRF